MSTTTTNLEVKVYCGTYHKYNSGSLKGSWVDLNDFDSLEDLYDAFSELHSDENDPEFMFQDFEIPEPFRYLISESSIDERIFDLLQMDSDDIIKVAAYLDQYPSEGLDMAFDNYDSMYIAHKGYLDTVDKWYLFEDRFPDAERMSCDNDYVEINYDRFISENYSHFEYEGDRYYYETN